MPKLTVIEADITTLEVDAIVNAANETLLGGAGVDGAIHAAAGPDLLAECRTLRGCRTGDAKPTKGYNLPAKWIVHTVGPIYKWGKSGEEGKLTACYYRSLEIAEKIGAKTVAFPAISTGAYGYPAEDAAHVAVKTVTRYLSDHGEGIDEVIFCCFDEKSANLYRKELDETPPPAPKPTADNMIEMLRPFRRG